MTKSKELAAPVRKILIFAPHTCDVPNRSGIQRVVLGLATTLPKFACVDLVKWDPIEGQLRYFDLSDFQKFFRSNKWPEGLSINLHAQRVCYRFSETVTPGTDVCVLMPEVFYHFHSGNEIHARVISQCTTYGWATAAVFYDLIPVRHPAYGFEAPHHRYVAELLRLDTVLSISKFSNDDLLSFLRESLQAPEAKLTAAEQRFVAVPLPESRLTDQEPLFCAREDETGPKDVILMIGTVEPRKQQLRIVEAFKRLRIAERAKLKLVIIGSLHQLVAKEFQNAIANDEGVEYLGYATDKEIAKFFARARFTIFASNDEGYGLPIAESLAHGVPCLTANFGSMREIAEEGGCLAVDTNDDGELEKGLLAFAFDDALIRARRSEIGRRMLRTWDDYARDVLDALFWPTKVRKATVAGEALISSPTVERALQSETNRWEQVRFSPDELVAGSPGIVLDFVPAGCPDAAAVDSSDHPNCLRAVAFLGSEHDLSRAPLPALRYFFGADAWFCRTKAVHDQLVALAQREAYDGMTPTCCGWPEDGKSLEDQFRQKFASLIMLNSRYAQIARREANYEAAFERIRLRERAPDLAVVISVYNREDFIERAVAWSAHIIAPLADRVRLIVVDNASTDDTRVRMEAICEELPVEYIRVSANTGLLGNLHTISCEVGARHVWVIGVDDVIVPGTLEKILSILDANPACPFIFPNFGVYHRTSIAPEEKCETFVGEYVPLSKEPAPTGRYMVKEIAQQHDNLFTAFYGIIFRSDLMAAVFNAPFTGGFFSSVMETVPSTEVTLKNFAHVSAVWLEKAGVVGNAHNTWRESRVAWHGVIMPLVLEMAREAGIDSKLLHRWSQIHIDLFEEAQTLFPDPTIGSRFSAEDLDASYRVFRQKLI